MLELTGTLQQEINKKADQNGNDYYYSWINCKDDSCYVFFFFRLDYNLSMRLTELQTNQKLTLQGCWSKKQSNSFLASGFYSEKVGSMEFIWSDNSNA